MPACRAGQYTNGCIAAAACHVGGMTEHPPPEADAPEPQPAKPPPKLPPQLPKEIGGTDGPEPTRYGDWQHKGRCTDF